jgi:hypothetical protein
MAVKTFLAQAHKIYYVPWINISSYSNINLLLSFSVLNRCTLGICTEKLQKVCLGLMSPQLFLMSRLRECISPSLLFSQLLFSLLCSFSLAAHIQRVETMLSGWVDIGAGQLQRTIAWEWAVYGEAEEKENCTHMDTRECFNCARSMRGVLVRAHNVVCFINATKLSAARSQTHVLYATLICLCVWMRVRASSWGQKQTKPDAHNAGFVSSFATMHWERRISRFPRVSFAVLILPKLHIRRE